MFSELVLNYENDQDKPFVLIRKSHAKLAYEKFKEIELLLLVSQWAEVKKLLEYHQIRLAFWKMLRIFT